MAKGAITVDVTGRVARKFFWRGVLERLVWFVSGVLIALLVFGGWFERAPEERVVVSEVRCDCNWHLLTESAAIYELVTPSEHLDRVAGGLEDVADEMKRTRKEKK